MNYIDNPGIIIFVNALLLGFMRKHQKVSIFISVFLLSVVSAIFYKKYFQVSKDIFYLSSSYIIVLLISVVYSILNERKSLSIVGTVYGGAAIYLIEVTNFLVLFFLVEVMLIAASYIIFNAKTKSSEASGLRYIKIHVVAGTLILLGILDHYEYFGHFGFANNIFYKFDISDIQTYKHLFLAAGLIINAAIFPFSAWLPDSYPQASSQGTCFLSVFTTKTAIFYLAKIYWGIEPLVYIGVISAIYGSIYLILENNIRRSMAYFLVIQNGILLVYIGIGGEVAQKNFLYILTMSSIYCYYYAFVSSFMVTKGVSYFSDFESKKKCNEYCLHLLILLLPIIGMPMSLSGISKNIIISSIDSPSLKFIFKNINIPIVIGTVGKLSVYLYKNTKNNQLFLSRDLSAVYSMFLLITMLGVFICFKLGIVPALDQIIFYAISVLVTISLTIIFSRLIICSKNKISLDIDWFYRFMLFKVYDYMLSLLIVIKGNLTIKLPTRVISRGKLQDYSNFLISFSIVGYILIFLLFVL